MVVVGSVPLVSSSCMRLVHVRQLWCTIFSVGVRTEGFSIEIERRDQTLTLLTALR